MFTLQLASATVQPPEQRAERLAALGGRILALPHSDRASAMRQFLDVPVQVVAGTRLAEVRAAVDGGVGGLLAREADLAQPGAAAHTDLLLSGRRPSEVARQHAISGTEAIGMLETALEPRVDEALAQRGATVQAVAQQFGIETTASLERMQGLAQGLARVRNGENVALVVSALGLTATSAIARLADVSLREVGIPAVRQGENVVHTARRLGIREPQSIVQLEQASVAAVGVSAVRSGEAPSQVAARLGIQHPGTVALLNAASQEDPVTKRRRL